MITFTRTLKKTQGKGRSTSGKANYWAVPAALFHFPPPACKLAAKWDRKIQTGVNGLAQTDVPSIKNPRKPAATGPDGVRAPAVHEEVYERLRKAIIAGQLEPGMSLSVRGLAAQFGVSAMPARDAIRRLAALGALEFTPTRRVTIARMTAAKIEELTVARTTLEPALARRALQRLNGRARDLDRLVAALARIDADMDGAIARGDIGLYAQTNSDFHYTLYDAAQSPVILGLVESLWLQVGPFMRVVIGRLGTSSLVDQHKEAIEALRAEDAAKLEEAIRLDILEGMTNIARAEI